MPAPGANGGGLPGRALAALDATVGAAIVVLISVMVAVVASQVLLRYLVNSSIGWADEISRLTFVWSIFLAIPLGIREGAHIGIELVTDRLPGAIRDALVRVIAAIGAAILLLVAYESAKLAAEQWDELMASVDFSSGWFLVPLAVGGVHGAIHLLRIAASGAGPTAVEPLRDLA